MLRVIVGLGIALGVSFLVIVAFAVVKVLIRENKFLRREIKIS